MTGHRPPSHHTPVCVCASLAVSSRGSGSRFSGPLRHSPRATPLRPPPPFQTVSSRPGRTPSPRHFRPPSRAWIRFPQTLPQGRLAENSAEGILDAPWASSARWLIGINSGDAPLRDVEDVEGHDFVLEDNTGLLGEFEGDDSPPEVAWAHVRCRCVQPYVSRLWTSMYSSLSRRMALSCSAASLSCSRTRLSCLRSLRFSCPPPSNSSSTDKYRRVPPNQVNGLVGLHLE